ncbi:hypothetical protein SLS54_005012 [Diplodia seriata]
MEPRLDLVVEFMGKHVEAIEGFERRVRDQQGTETASNFYKAVREHAQMFKELCVKAKTLEQSLGEKLRPDDHLNQQLDAEKIKLAETGSHSAGLESRLASCKQDMVACTAKLGDSEQNVLSANALAEDRQKTVNSLEQDILQLKEQLNSKDELLTQSEALAAKYNEAERQLRQSNASEVQTDRLQKCLERLEITATKLDQGVEKAHDHTDVLAEAQKSNRELADEVARLKHQLNEEKQRRAAMPSPNIVEKPPILVMEKGSVITLLSDSLLSIHSAINDQPRLSSEDVRLSVKAAFAESPLSSLKDLPSSVEAALVERNRLLRDDFSASVKPIFLSVLQEMELGSYLKTVVSVLEGWKKVVEAIVQTCM